MDLYEKLAQKRQLERMKLQAESELKSLETKKRQYQDMNKKMENAITYSKNAIKYISDSENQLLKYYVSEDPSRLFSGRTLFNMCKRMYG